MSDSVTASEPNDCASKSSFKNGPELSAGSDVFVPVETTLGDCTEPVTDFDQLNLRETLLRGIYGYGFERPSEPQQQALRPCIAGRDVIVHAPSGTGKSVACIIAVLQRIDLDCKDLQALILAPARELAQGFQRLVSAVGEHMNVTCYACVGGTHVREDMKRLEAGVQIVTGTPGRVCDMFRRSVLRSDKLKVLVLEEADETLSRGFDDQINEVMQLLPASIQVIVASASMPQELTKITQKFMNNPVNVVVRRDDRTLEGIRQYYVNIEREEWKLETLLDLLDLLAITQAVVYCNKREGVDQLSEKLREHGATVSTLHGEMDAKQRNDTIKEFRTGASRILIRTDAVGDSTDVPHVSLVVNYDLPVHRDQYIDRIGRRGAFGRKGTAINFIGKEEQQTLREIERFYNTRIEELPTDIADVI